MPVAVSRADGDQPDLSVEELIQAGRLIGRAVMRDLDDVDRAHLAGREHRILWPLAEIAEEDGPDAPSFELDRHAAGIAAGELVDGPTAHRPQDRPREPSEFTADARRAQFDERTSLPELLEVGFVAGFDGAPHDRPFDLADDARKTSGMVDVEMGQNEQVERADAEPVQAVTDHFRMTADVDQSVMIAVSHKNSVALADVARGDLPVRGKGQPVPPAPSRQGPRIDSPTCHERDCREDGQPG